MQVPLTSPQGSSHAVLALGMLHSYSQTGIAEVHCREGCACEGSTWDLRHENHVSMTFWKSLSVQNLPESEHCSVEIINASKEEARPKVKVSFPRSKRGLAAWLCRCSSHWCGVQVAAVMVSHEQFLWEYSYHDQGPVIG